ncbi:MAG: PAS domain-containing protein [Pseudomonadota bacterium]
MAFPHTPHGSDDHLSLRMMVLESRAKALFVHHPGPIYELDPEGRFRHANVAGARLAGLNENEGQGMHFTRFLLPQDRREVERHFEQAMNGRHTGCVAHICNLAGQEYRAELYMLPIASECNTLGVYVLVNPAGQPGTPSDALQARQLLEALPLGAAVLDTRRDGYPVVMANPALSALLDMPREQMLEQPLATLRDGEDAAVQRLEQALARQQSARERLSVSRPDGQRLAVEVQLEALAAPGEHAPSSHVLALHVPLHGQAGTAGTA